MSDKSSGSIQEITKVLFERHMAIREKMCIEELTRIIDEQIKSGDFMQYVCHSDNSFAFTYLPYRGVVRLKKELQAEREKVALLQEAVEFYADINNYDLGGDCPNSAGTWQLVVNPGTMGVCGDEFVEDCGDVARQALEELKSLRGKNER